MEQNHKPEGCDCPMHKAREGVRPFPLPPVGHVRPGHTFTKAAGGFNHHSDQELRMLEDMITRFRPSDADPEQDSTPRNVEGVSGEELLGVLGAIVSALKNLQVNVAAPNVHVAPSLAVEPHTEKVTILRDEKNQMTGSIKEIMPQ